MAGFLMFKTENSILEHRSKLPYQSLCPSADMVDQLAIAME